MCLVKISKFPRITLSYKVVYKTVILSKETNMFMTPFVEDLVVIGNTYTGRFINCPLIKGLVKSFKSKYIRDGYIHCYKDIYNTNGRLLGEHIIECIIPPFTLYWVGEYGEIATRKLKYVKHV